MEPGGVVKLRRTDDDFIAPSQQCVKPLTDRLKQKLGRRDGGRRRPGAETVTLAAGDDAKAPLPSVVTISLNDCLACSGCVTSAQTVLIERQSHQLLRRHLAGKAPGDLCLVTLSPQSRASLAAHYKTTGADVLLRLATFFAGRGVDLIFDSNFARALTLHAAGREFVRRYRRANGGGRQREHLPVISGVCPGWVCLVEKTHGSIVPYLSTVRSPQAVAGAVLKRYVAKRRGASPSRVFHCAVMPCYDKKLEAARPDLTLGSSDGGDSAPETDCVISTREVVSWLQEEGAQLMQLAPYDCGAAGDSSILSRMCYDSGGQSTSPCASADGGSGGYAMHVMRYAIGRLFGVGDECAADIETIRVSKDLEELRYEHAATGGRLVFARAYGLRNVQNVAMRIKRGKCHYDYVEAMACPSGCANGGGQMRPATLRQHGDTLAACQRAYADDAQSAASTVGGDSCASFDSDQTSVVSELFGGDLDAIDRSPLMNCELSEMPLDDVMAASVMKW